MVTVIPSGSLPRSEPVLRWSRSVGRVDDDAEVSPVIHDGRVILRGRPGEAWTAFDLEDGSVLSRGEFPFPVAECSAPALSADGRVASFAFRSVEEGFVLLEHRLDGSLLGATPVTGQPYAHEEGPTPADMGVPDWLPGPGTILAPHEAADGAWIVCSEDIESGNWRTVCVATGEKTARWSRDERFWGGNAGLAIVSSRVHGFAAIDTRTGTERWRPESVSHYSVAHGDGRHVAFCGRHDKTSPLLHLSVHDMETGDVCFRRETKSQFGDRVWICDGRTLYRDGHQIQIFALDGTVLEAGENALQMLAFDGVQILTASRDTIACGPAAEPGARSWVVRSPALATERPKRSVRVAAVDGWIAILHVDRSVLEVFAPELVRAP